MASPPEPGRLRDALLVLAAKTWRHPDSGLDVHFGVSTLERWYYPARRSEDPLVALRDRLRGDEGRFPSMHAATARPKNFIAIAYLRLSRLKNLPSHPFAATAAVK